MSASVSEVVDDLHRALVVYELVTTVGSRDQWDMQRDPISLTQVTTESVAFIVGSEGIR